MNKYKKIVVKIIVLLLFFLFSFTIILVANGYWFDFKLQKLRKTSIIHLHSEKPLLDLNISVNDKLIADKMPVLIKGLEAGEYKLNIQKNGFQPINSQVEVETEVVTKLSNLKLIPDNIETSIAQVEKIETGYTVAYLTDKFLILNGKDDVLIYKLINYRFSDKVSLKDIDLTKGVREVNDRLLLKRNDGRELVYGYENQILIKSELERQVRFENLQILGEIIVLFRGDRSIILNRHFKDVKSARLIDNKILIVQNSDLKQDVYLVENESVGLIMRDSINDPVWFGNDIYLVNSLNALYRYDLAKAELFYVMEIPDVKIVGSIGYPWLVTKMIENDNITWKIFNVELKEKFNLLNTESGKFDLKAIGENLIRIYPDRIEKFEF